MHEGKRQRDTVEALQQDWSKRCNTGKELTSLSTPKHEFDDTLTAVTGPCTEGYIKLVPPGHGGGGGGQAFEG